jgi:predicted NBD/HSP70 family sugar kinase
MAQKATRAGVKEHNRRLILRFVFSGEAVSRVKLARLTGLAKPTVSDIVSDLIEEGLLEESGRGESTESGGKRPRLLSFRPEAQQIIGVAINDNRAYGALANLNGEIVAQHRASMNGAQGEFAQTVLQEVINGLIAQLQAPLLCVSIGAPGIVENNTGVVIAAPSLQWYDLRLADQLSKQYQTQVYVSNNTELAVRAQFAFGAGAQADNLVMLLINSSVEIGVAYGGLFYHHSGDLGLLRVGDPNDVHSETRPLTAYLGWDAVQRRLSILRRNYPETTLPEDNLNYLHIRQGYLHNDALCLVIYDELAGHLAQVFAWITGLMRPDHIALAGAIVDLGPALLDQATRQAGNLLPPALVDAVTFSLNEDRTLSATGTITHALQKALGVL